MDRLIGTGVALVTPFDERQRIDRESLYRLVNYVIDGGVDFLVALGTTAETATLSADERAVVVHTILEANQGRLPVIAGIGGNNTAEVIRELQAATWLKDCQGILSITPCYNKPTQRGLYEHFKAIAAASPLPLCLYNVPGRSGVNMEAATVAALSHDCPNIIAVKEASGRFDQATAILKSKRADFAALSGEDALLLPLMSLGFEGVISVIANVLPNDYACLVKSALQGDYPTARRIHLDRAELCKALFEEGNPAGIKAALHAAGIIRHNTLRLPLTPVSDALYDKIIGLLKLH